MPQDRPQRFALVALRLAALWVAAGALFKLFAGTPNDLPPVVQQLAIGRDLTFRLAIAAELTVVFAVLLRPRWSWPLIVALFAAFDVVLALLVGLLVREEGVTLLAALFSPDVSCGCFGSTITIPPGVMMSIDSALCLLVLAGRPWRAGLRPLAPAWVPAVLIAAGIAAPFAYIPSAEWNPGQEGDSSQRYCVIDLEEWEGEYIYDTQLARIVPQPELLPSDASYVFWRQTCDHCAAHLRRLAETDDMSRPYVLIRLKEKGDTPENAVVQLKPSGGHVTELELPDDVEYVLTTPADLDVEGGIVVRTREGIGVEDEGELVPPPDPK